MTSTQAIDKFQADYDLERQWQRRRHLGQRPWSRHDHQYQMYWVYIQWNWRSMTPDESKIVFTEPKEKPKVTHKH